MSGGVRLELDYRDGGIGAALRKAQARGNDLRPALQTSGAAMVEHIHDRFDTGTGPGGVKWIPSQRPPRGIEKKKGKASPSAHQTMVDKGALEASITFEITDKEMRVGSGANAGGNVNDKAAILQFGGTITPKRGEFLVFRGSDGTFRKVRSVTIPARPYVGFDEADIVELDDIFTTFAEGGFQ